MTELTLAVDEFQVNTVVENSQSVSFITPLTDGRFLIVWDDFEVRYVGGVLELVTNHRGQIFNFGRHRIW